VKLKVTYLDGRQVEVNAGPAAEVAVERKFAIAFSEISRSEEFYYLAHAALFKAGKEPADFDAWLDLIEDVDPIRPQTAEEKFDAQSPMDPTRAAGSAVSSS
jgi:hypothetical protein